MTQAWLLGIVIVLAAAGVALAIGFYYRTLYAAPWFLLVGPSDAEKSTLVAGAIETAFPRKGWLSKADERDIAWRYFKDGVVIDVAGGIAFPPGGADLTRWQRLLDLLTRYRPRRPVDGVILAIPASLLLDDNWQRSTQDLGAALRERLTLAQGHFGFVLPVWVVVTQCDRLRGFTAFGRAVPESLLQNMLGWSNTHGADQTFTDAWIAEGFARLHRSLVHAQVEVFASSARLDDAADLFLFSGEVGRLATPLRVLLEEVFRPNLYHESYFLRGFYLCGEVMPRQIVADVDLEAAAPSFHASPIRSVNFIGDLLDMKVFPERGLATPLPDVSVARLRGSVAGLVIAALLAVGLAAGTVWSYLRVRSVQGSYAQVLTAGADLLEQRRQVQGNERTLSDQELQDRLTQSRSFLQLLQTIRGNRFTAILTAVFMPASLVAPIDPAFSSVVARVVGDVVLGDIRAGLEHKGRGWLGAAAPQPDDRPGPLGPDLKDSAPYQALERFAQNYAPFVDNYRRYERLARGEGAADLSAQSELLAYLSVTPLAATALAPAVGRAVQAARSTPIACGLFEVDAQSHDSLVRKQASALLRDFGDRSFGKENPVVAAASDFESDWTTISKGTGDTATFVSLIENTTTLSQAVTAWAALGARSKALRIPVFELPPFKRIAAADGFCEALRPDLNAPIVEVAMLKDQLTDRLLKVEVDPFSPLFEEGDKGLALNADVAKLKMGFDDLQRQPFWSPLPPEIGGVLPSNPIWPGATIDDAVKLSDAFASYRGQAFSGQRVSDRRALLSVVGSEVAQLVATRLALTAVAGAPPATDAAARVDQITQLGAQLAKLTGLVPLLASQSPFGRDILRTLDQQASRALQDIDATASARLPSIFARRPGPIFTAWTDIQAAAPAAEALKRWGGIADDQREGARQMALQAQPIVNYLAARQPSDLVRRWTGIAADVASYDQKRPDNGLSALDTAIRDSVPATVPEKDCSPGGNGPLTRATGFFATVRNDIVDEAVRRCRALVEDRYATIASAFNRLLYSKFPFSRGLDGAPEATPAQAAEFLRVYDAQSGRSLRQALEMRACSEEAVTFIRQMDTVYALMSSVRDLATPAVVLDVVPEFRVAQDRDNGGDQIAQWQLDVGRQTIPEPVPVTAKPAPWTSGDPVSVTFRFARDSPNRPVTGAPFARIEDRAVHFDFRGAWALFRLLRTGRASAVGVLGVRDASPAVLGFEIPVERDPTRPPLVGPAPPSPFKVYMRLRLFQPGKMDPLPVDEFPVEAPLRASCPSS